MLCVSKNNYFQHFFSIQTNASQITNDKCSKEPPGKKTIELIIIMKSSFISNKYCANSFATLFFKFLDDGLFSMVDNYYCKSSYQTEDGIANATSKCGEDPNCAMVSTLNCNDEDAVYNLCEMSTELVPKLGACTRWKIGTELTFTISKKISTFKY